VHTFETAAAKQKFDVNPGSLVMFLADRLQTKYEDKRHVLEIKVGVAYTSRD